VNILVIYDSYFGHTEKVALAMVEELKTIGNVEHANVKQQFPDNPGNYDLLIVGSPLEPSALQKPQVSISKLSGERSCKV
jgi:menaquinone-dependent protoporphyrinogen IX oxidase